MPTAKIDQIAITPETIGFALKNLRLEVPVHQRSYKWEAEHVTDLYQDLGSAINDNEPEYFLGSIVLVTRDDGQLEVNDGQQRLATSMMLIAAIRDAFLSLSDDKTAAIVESDFLFTTDRKTLDTFPKLKLNIQDHDFFVKRILLRPDHADRIAIKSNSQNLKDSHRRIIRAAKVAADHVNNLIAAYKDRRQDSSAVLHKWLDYLEKGARVIRVQVASERTAYVIFETMNDRGLRLSAADLLKNRLYGMATDRINEVIERWQKMTGALETLGDEEDTILVYIRHLWIALHGHVRSRQLYDKIRDTITNKQMAVDLSVQLENNAPRYAALLNPSHEMWAGYEPNVRKRIDTLGVFNVTQVRPLLLAAIDKFSKSEVSRLVHGCVCWSARCLLSGVSSGTLEGYYNRNAYEITQGKFKKTDDVTSAMLSIVPDDSTFKARVSTVRIAPPPLARYYLRALQREADGETEPQYLPNEGKEITLEHIMPQQLGKDWKHITADDFKQNYHRLGNLALLQATPNSTLGNVSYDKKKPELADSKFSLTKAAGSSKIKTWGPAEIAARQEMLADLAVKTWPLRIK